MINFLPTENKQEVRKANNNTANQKKKIITGTSEMSGLRSMERYPNRGAIFVSRIGPRTSGDEIKKAIFDDLKIANIECTRINTKYNTYASFEVLCAESEAHRLLDPDFWPAGYIVSICFLPAKTGPPFGTQKEHYAIFK